MESIRRQADDSVPGFYRRSGNNAIALHHPDDKSCYVVLAVGVEAGHLGGLSADQSATVLAASVRQTGDDFLGDLRIEFSAGKIVEKEKRSSALHGNIVHTVVHQITADRVVQIHLEGYFQL